MADNTSNPLIETAAGAASATARLLGRINLHGLAEDSLGGILSGVLTVIVEQTGADSGCMWLKDEKGALYCAAFCGSESDSEKEPKLNESLVQEIMRSTDAVMMEEATGACSDANIRWIMGAPIRSGDAVFGAIYLGSAADDRRDQTQADIIVFLGGHIGLALDNLHLRKACEENRRLAAAGKATLKLSHSMKNILQMVSGAAEVVDFGLRTNQMHRVRRSWDILKPNLDRLKKYTLEMLDYSKERPLNLGSCDFNRIIQGAIESLKAQLKTKNSKINIRIDQKIPCVEMDGDRIHEMALNLILNAIDVVDSEGGLVSVETRYDADRRAISLSVTDNGPGISEAMKEKIFTPFESGKKKFGTGLGMAIAKQIVDQHKGIIEIESLGFRGTTFTVTLPANPPTAA